MSYVFKPEPAFGPAPLRGGAAVGMMTELPMLEMSCIVLLRQWCDGPEGRDSVARGFSDGLGPDVGADGAALLAQLITLFAQCGRRPLMRHGVHCACFGGDESAFSQLIAAATSGDRDDAMAFAMILLPPAVAYEAVQTAQRLGPMILALARVWSQPPATRTRH